MAKALASGALLSKLGPQFKKAVEGHKSDETKVSAFGDLPAGIEGGVAQLLECGFFEIDKGKTNAGKIYFRATGIVQTPERVTVRDEETGTVQVVKVAGKRTTIMENLFDTLESSGRKTIDEHVAWILNQLRLLAGDDIATKISADNIEQVCALLAKAKPYFEFRTWKGKKATSGKYKDKEPRVQHTWLGKCEKPDMDAGEAQEDGDDSGSLPDDGSEDHVNGAAEEAEAAPAKPKRGKGKGKAAEEVAFDEFKDLKSLLTKAKKNDVDAGDKLRELALEKGFTEEDVDAASWDEVYKMIVEGKPDDARDDEPQDADDELDFGDDDESQEPEVKIPEVGEVVNYKGKKDSKPSKWEVVKVDEDSETVILRSKVDRKKGLKDIPWADLS